MDGAPEQVRLPPPGLRCLLPPRRHRRRGLLGRLLGLPPAAHPHVRTAQVQVQVVRLAHVLPAAQGLHTHHHPPAGHRGDPRDHIQPDQHQSHLRHGHPHHGFRGLHLQQVWRHGLCAEEGGRRRPLRPGAGRGRRLRHVPCGAAVDAHQGGGRGGGGDDDDDRERREQRVAPRPLAPHAHRLRLLRHVARVHRHLRVFLQ
mmetsp:Transcript_9022/g.23692  ORF Transcript_9022/g.23692 Transcript_9022/m.23692 type:complete len:201 (-) Transcript_9022:1679-2281(-)